MLKVGEHDKFCRPYLVLGCVLHFGGGTVFCCLSILTPLVLNNLTESEGKDQCFGGAVGRTASQQRVPSPHHPVSSKQIHTT